VSQAHNRMGFESVLRKSPICQYATACYYDHHKLPMFAFHHHKKVPYLSNQVGLSNSNTSVYFKISIKLEGKWRIPFLFWTKVRILMLCALSINASFTQFGSPPTQSHPPPSLFFPCLFSCIYFPVTVALVFSSGVLGQQKKRDIVITWS